MVPKQTLNLSGSRSLWGLAECYASVDEVDLVLETGWTNDCVALAMQVISCHCGCLP